MNDNKALEIVNKIFKSVFDKTNSFSMDILLEKFANGEDLTSENFSKEFFTINGSYYNIYDGENGESIVNVCSMYNYSDIDESGNTFFDEKNCLKDGTKVNIIEIRDNGNEYKIKTEDGRVLVIYII